jgi:hypothetical protein
VAAEDGVLHFEDFDGVFDGGGDSRRHRWDMGTTLPALRVMKRSPGSVWRMRSGRTRESEQVMKSHWGSLHLGEEVKLVAFGGEDSS